MIKEQASVFIASLVGTISILVSIAGIVRGGAFSDHYLGLFCGVTLVGTAFFHHLEMRRRK